MKVFFVYLLFMIEPGHQGVSTAFVHEAPCRDAAAALNAQVGPKRGIRWECQKQGVER